MAIQLDTARIQWPPPGSFEANILRTIAVPYQPTNVSGRECPADHPLEEAALPVLKNVWRHVGVISLPDSGKAP
jgi:hypothetical protein